MTAHQRLRRGARSSCSALSADVRVENQNYKRFWSIKRRKHLQNLYRHAPHLQICHLHVINSCAISCINLRCIELILCYGPQTPSFLLIFKYLIPPVVPFLFDSERVGLYSMRQARLQHHQSSSFTLSFTAAVQPTF